MVNVSDTRALRSTVIAPSIWLRMLFSIAESNSCTKGWHMDIAGSSALVVGGAGGGFHVDTGRRVWVVGGHAAPTRLVGGAASGEGGWGGRRRRRGL